MTRERADIVALVTTHLALIAPRLSSADRVQVLAYALGLALADATWPNPPGDLAPALAGDVARRVSAAQHRRLRAHLRGCAGRA